MPTPPAKVRSAGILIYTAAADSDGTLGGLVDLGKPENLGRLLEQALNRSKICSSDPLCSEHDPQKDRSLHAAACHACSLVAEHRVSEETATSIGHCWCRPWNV